MRVNLEFELEPRDEPSYCSRVNEAMRLLLQDKIFLNGLGKSGQLFGYWTQGSFTKVTVTYDA
jgi:hypothetical protein